jgi:phosphate transport system permease protein
MMRMSGVPSIAVGIFVYTLIVLEQRHFSALAGGVALAIIMLPTIMRTTEEMLRMVRHAARGGLALGAPKRRAIVRVALRTAAPGILHGHAHARVAGETARVLLFTALATTSSRPTWTKPIPRPCRCRSTPTRSCPTTTSTQAWAAALVLVFRSRSFA